MKIKVSELPIKDALLLTAFRAADPRGNLAKYLEQELCAKLRFAANEAVVSHSKKGVIRGLHYQIQAPQAKLVWCTSGSVYDVLLDLRASSPNFGKWHAVGLSAKEGTGVYVPPGIAHGFQALEDSSSMLYLFDNGQKPEYERGVLYSDPRLSIGWPLARQAVVSERDMGFPLFSKAEKFR